jgi:hypothetical protein
MIKSHIYNAYFMEIYVSLLLLVPSVLGLVITFQNCISEIPA